MSGPPAGADVSVGRKPGRPSRLATGVRDRLVGRSRKFPAIPVPDNYHSKAHNAFLRKILCSPRSVSHPPESGVRQAGNVAQSGLEGFRDALPRKRIGKPMPAV